MKQSNLLLLLLFLFTNSHWVMGQCPRQAVIDNYTNQYLTANFTDAELNWTGDTASCTLGSMSEIVRAKHLQKINYFKALVGGLAPVSLEEAKNEKALAAVLMFEAANNISHCGGVGGAPCNTYPCSSATAIEAARNGNISYSIPDWNLTDPIDLYMRGEGIVNADVPHRRWILNSKAQEMGVATSTGFNALWVMGNEAASPTYKEFIAYPPKGYMPQPLVPERWSFGIPDADFSKANVSIQDGNGNTISPPIISDYTKSYGDNSIVWQPTGILLDSDRDIVYTITIDNIEGATQSSYTYETTIVPISYPPLCPNGMEWVAANCQCETPLVCPPQVAIGQLDNNECAGYPNNFQVNGTIASSYIWDYGDGFVNTGSILFPGNMLTNRASHVYDKPGDYTITLYIAYPNGCLDTAYYEKKIISSYAEFTYTLDGNTIYVMADTTNAAHITGYYWSFGDGGSAFTRTPNTSYTYSNTGRYTVQLETEGTCVDRTSFQAVDIGDCIDFSVRLSMENKACDKYTFTAFPSGGTPPYKYNWTPEGFNTDSFYVANHLFTGINLVTITDANGCEVKEIFRVNLDQNIAANFTYTFTTNNILLTDLSTGNIVSKEWTLNAPDAIIVDNQVAIPPPGSYEICLIVKNICDITSTNCQTLIIVESTTEVCFDELDNDGDGLIDCDDSDCPCLDCPRDLTLNLQSQVDSFRIKYPGCHEILGDLLIQSTGSSITNLDPLKAVTNINGDLIIANNETELNLSGLQNVSTIGGDLIVKDNPLLYGLFSLTSLVSIGGDFIIGENDRFGLLFVNDAFNLSYIGGDFKINGNTALKDLDYWGDLTQLNGNLEIANQSTLTSLSGLENLTAINGSLILKNNKQLNLLSALSNLQRINGALIVENNSQLISLTGLDNIAANTINDLRLSSSARLNFCNIASICAYLETGRSAAISGNAIDCASENALRIACAGSITPPIFEQYPWLYNYVNPNHCSVDKITQYATYAIDQPVFYIETATEAKLYTKSGSLLCTSTPNYDCVSLYMGREIIRTWTCGDPFPLDEDKDATLSDTDPDDKNPCIPNNTAEPCDRKPGPPHFLPSYPWLANLASIDFNTCTDEKITIYVSNGDTYLFVESSRLATLYDAAGQRYCSNTPTFNCLEAYPVDEIIDMWLCGDPLPDPVDTDNDGVFSDADPNDNDPCVPNSNNSGCEPNTDGNNGNVSAPPIFLTEYPWLSELINFEDCNTDKITVYSSNGYLYLQVETKTNTILYNARGQTYCTNGPNYKCEEFYVIDEIVAVWNCGDTAPIPSDSDGDGVFSDTDPDDTDPCVPDNSSTDCDMDGGSGNNGGSSIPPDFLDDYPWLSDLINFEDCSTDKVMLYISKGYTYLLVETPERTILYNAGGQTYCTNGVNYKCEEFYTIDEVVATWSCDGSTPVPIAKDEDNDGYDADIDEDDNNPCLPDDSTAACAISTSELPPLFEDYAWLTTIINPLDCKNEKITVYTSLGYIYLFVESSTSAILYNASGARYCANSVGYDCRSFYIVEEELETWECGDANIIVDPCILNPNTCARNIQNATKKHNEQSPILDFQLYPNPSTGQFFVELSDNMISAELLTILNTQGQIIKTLPITTNTTGIFQLDLSNQVAGIYFVQMQSNRGSSTKRLVIR